MAILHQLGIRVVLVHGGGPQLDEVTAQLGVATRMVQGRRVTDAAAIDATSMVLNGLINTRLLALCREFGIAAVGISGVDARARQGARRPPVTLASGEVVDYGIVGDIDGVDASVITRLLDNGLLPVVSPLSCGRHGPAAQHQCRHGRRGDRRRAGGGEADPLHRRAGHPRALDDPHSLISYTDLAGLRRLREEGTISDGMLPKSSAIEAAIRGGVRRVHVISYAAPDACSPRSSPTKARARWSSPTPRRCSAAEQGAG